MKIERLIGIITTLQKIVTEQPVYATYTTTNTETFSSVIFSLTPDIDNASFSLASVKNVIDNVYSII